MTRSFASRFSSILLIFLSAPHFSRSRSGAQLVDSSLQIWSFNSKSDCPDQTSQGKFFSSDSFLTIFKFQPRAVSSSEDEDELEPVYPGPICISCSGIDNDPLIWCSGCCEPFHYECAKGFPKSKYGTTYKWFCLDCRQSCISCSYPVLTISTFECKSCWRIIHRRCIDPQVRSTSWLLKGFYFLSF